MTQRLLMLVSARADQAVRAEVAGDVRPCPEYLVLEERHGVELLDWSRLPGRPRQRSAAVSVLHVAVAAAKLHRYDAVFSDGEHVGLPLAVAAGRLGSSRPHLMLAHHLTSPRKRRFVRWMGKHDGIRILMHSQRQMALAGRELGIPQERMAVVPYYADTEFWRPAHVAEEPLVVSAGREHRDYATLAAAASDLNVKVFVAAGSAFSPRARSSRWPEAWPDNFQVEPVGYRRLRDLYARSSVVVVPVVETDFQAGITVVLEAMAMGKAVVVTKTSGQCEAVVDGVSGLVVPNGDVPALRDAIRRLLAEPDVRVRLGRNAREQVLSGFGLRAYADTLAAHLHALARGSASN